MDVVLIAAIIFSVASAGVVAFQLAMALGAPWGAYTMGGKFPGRLPVSMRAAAVVQAIVIALLAAVVLAHAGVILESWADSADWLVWVVVAVSGVSLILNSLTSSALERRVWVPVAVVMLAASITVAVA